MNNKFKEFLPPLLLFLLVTVFFFPILFQGQTFIGSGLIYSDLATLNFPLKDLLSQSLKEGSLPFWTTLIGNGTPIMAESQIGALYPFHLLLFKFLPTMAAFNLNLFLHFLLAALGMYAFVRISLRLGWSAGVLAALAFSFSGFMITRIHQTNIILVVAWLPVIFLLIERVVTRQKLLFALLLGSAFAFQILAGYFEMFYYSLLGGALFAVLLLLSQKEKVKPVIFLFLSLVIALGLTAPQTLSTWEMTKYSIRSQGLTMESAASDTWPLKTFLYFVNPRAWDIYTPNQSYKPSDETTVSLHDLYGYVGFLPLVLALGATLFLFRKKTVMIFVVLLVFALIMSLGRSTQVFTIFWETIPGIKFFRFPTKWLFFIEFALAVLAAYGWEGIIGRMKRIKRIERIGEFGKLGMVGGGLVLIVFGDLYFNNRPLQPMTDTNFFDQPKAVEVIKDGLKEGNYRLYSHGTNNIDPATMKDTKLQKEFMNILPPDTNILYGLPSNREWYTLFLARQHELTRLNTGLNPETGVLTIPPQMKKSLDLQGVKYLLSDLKIDDTDLILAKEIPLSKQVYHLAYMMTGGQMQVAKIPVEKTYVYENQGVLPRVMWISKVEKVGQVGEVDEVEILEKVLGEDFDPIKAVILEDRGQKTEDGNEKTEDGRQIAEGGKVEIKKYKEQEVEIEVNAEKPGFLVLTDTYYPGWKAYLLGASGQGTAVSGEGIKDDENSLTPSRSPLAAELKIYRADFAFRAVEVPAGKHLVKFSFEPTYWKLGLWISLGTLLIVFLGLSYCLIKRK